MRQLAAWDLECLFPIWGRPTSELAESFIRDGFRAITVCVDPARLPAPFAGRPYDRAFFAELPDAVDPCGENGEFHTFAFDGPIFSRPIDVSRGRVVERGGFVFCDLTARSGNHRASGSLAGSIVTGNR